MKQVTTRWTKSYVPFEANKYVNNVTCKTEMS